MERLKSILADKILDLSAGSGDEVKVKIDKIQRFRDFANALKSMMLKYPAIEDELISMVEGGDFDTKVASSRVDTVIRLADAEADQLNRASSTLKVEAENQAIENPVNVDDIPMEIYEGGEEEPLSQPEDVDYEELQDSSEDDKEKGYVPYEENFANEDNTDPDSVTEAVLYPDQEDIDQSEDDCLLTGDLFLKQEDINQSEEEKEDDDTVLTDEELAAKRKVIIKRVFQVIGIILAVVALIFIIIFIKNNLKVVLITVGIAAVLFLLFVWFKRKR
ncbi:MAG: hypothetical protein LBN74_03550 [Prevotella sp.]|jgi:hypothetical protein|nr:hypothetical protein [Prevotella sp.]